MKGFSPIKRRAKEFEYKPRFYDPQKEARDERRAELRGRTSKSDNEEYTPGAYIKRQSEARSLSRSSRKKGPSNSILMKVFIAAMVFLLAYMLLPRIIAAFTMSGQTPTRVEAIDEYQDFDPYAPIRIVPNDYQAE